MRRIPVVLVLLVAATVWPATNSLANGAVATNAAAAANLQADFNSDGFADLAVGVPAENAGAIDNAGAVNVLYGTAAGLTGTGSQLFTQDSPGVGSSAEPSDLFGRTLAAGDFNHDSFADLAVGAPGEAVNAVTSAGAVNVLPGTAGKLTGVGSQLFTQDSAGGSAAEAGDLFAAALAAGDFDNDSFDDLAVGVPDEGVFAIPGAGAVNVLYGSAGLLAVVGSQLFTQDSAGVGSAAEQGDDFGGALAASGPQSATTSPASPASDSGAQRTALRR